MREEQIRRLMESGYPVVARVPKRVRVEFETQGVILPGVIEGPVVDMARHSRESMAVVLYGLGHRVELLARHILRLRGRGDSGGLRDRFVGRTKIEDKRWKQMRLPNEMFCR